MKNFLPRIVLSVLLSTNAACLDLDRPTEVAAKLVDHCLDLSTAWCEMSVRCGDEIELAFCIDGFMQTCCDGENEACKSPSRWESKLVNHCVEVLDENVCGEALSDPNCLIP